MEMLLPLYPFKSLLIKPPVNSGHYFGVPMVVVEHRFDCIKKRNIFYSVATDLGAHKGVLGKKGL